VAFSFDAGEAGIDYPKQPAGRFGPVGFPPLALDAKRFASGRTCDSHPPDTL
tara:strand:- start:303 stop:458 length:156 start_codon:yes stop_codon:yes gene_type:complete